MPDTGKPDDTPSGDRLPLGDANKATVRELAAILASADTTREPAPGTGGIAGAATRLRTAAQAAGIELRLGAPRTGPCGQGRLPLGDVDHDTPTRQADLYNAEDALRATLDAVGATAEQLSANGDAIELHDLTVPEGVALLRQLVPGKQAPDVDPDDQCPGEDLADHLSDADRKVTGSGFTDEAYTTCCRKCHGEPSILLGRLPLPYAQALTAHLTRATA